MCSSLFWKALQIRINYFSLHRHFERNFPPDGQVKQTKNIPHRQLIFLVPLLNESLGYSQTHIKVDQLYSSIKILDERFSTVFTFLWLCWSFIKILVHFMSQKSSRGFTQIFDIVCSIWSIMLEKKNMNYWFAKDYLHRTYIVCFQAFGKQINSCT